MVVEDRIKNSYHFNQELLKMFQQRRRNEASKRGGDGSRLQEKKRRFRCLDEFNVFDNVEKQQDEHARASYADNDIPHTCTSFEEV